MKRPARSFLHLAGAALAAAALPGALPAPARPDDGGQPAPPHVLLVLADDLGYGDPGCYNPESSIPTPHLDRLAREGLRFTDAHSPASICTPSRYALLTGRYAWRSRLRTGNCTAYSRALIPPGRPTLPSVLARAGYATVGIGKWHLGLGSEGPGDFSAPLDVAPVHLGFERYFGIPGNVLWHHPPFTYFADDRFVVLPPEERVQVEGASRGKGWWGEEIELLPQLTRRAVGAIEAHAAAEDPRPLFLYVAYPSPHVPLVPTTRAAGKSGAGAYGDFVWEVDWAVGELLAALDDAGMASDTLVIVTSDNGSRMQAPDHGNGALRGAKGSCHEGGHRVPFLVRWPGVSPAGATSDALLSSIDLLRTFATLVGAELPEDAAEDSVDQLHALRAARPTSAGRTELVHHAGKGLRSLALRSGSWKWIPGREELFDLSGDPAEAHNRFADEPERARRMDERLLELVANGRSTPGPKRANDPPEPELDGDGEAIRRSAFEAFAGEPWSPAAERRYRAALRRAENDG